MGYIPRERVEQAASVTLLDYLKSRDPKSLVDLGGGNWCLKQHDSLKMSNGKWYWFSRGYGGHSALDFLIKAEGMTLPQAVSELTGTEVQKQFIGVQEQGRKEFVLPEASDDSSKAAAYLRKRGISSRLIGYCLDNELLYQSKEFQNVVFVGKDREGVPRHAAVRSIYGPYRGDVKGSDKRFSFRIKGEGQITELHIFEAAIDLLSWLTLMEYRGEDTQGKMFLSLSGVSGTGKKLPAALQEALDEEKSIRTAVTHLDRDEAGKRAAQNIMETLGGTLEVRDEPPDTGKDVNDMLMAYVYGIDTTAKGSKEMHGGKPRNEEEKEI